jgi:hypothetical protein
MEGIGEVWAAVEVEAEGGVARRTGHGTS